VFDVMSFAEWVCIASLLGRDKATHVPEGTANNTASLLGFLGQSL
jgi:hypothetical protein